MVSGGDTMTDILIVEDDKELAWGEDPEDGNVDTDADGNYIPYDSYQYELGRKVPFVIWTKNMNGTKLNMEITDVMGMIDVQPTLGNMLGFYNKYSMGHDIFNNRGNNLVVFPNGNWVSDKVYYNSQKGEYLSLTQEAISEEYIKSNTEYANNLLDTSNNIIVFDLLNKEKYIDK